MKSRWSFLALVLCATAATATEVAPVAEPVAIEKLAWLSGCWASVGREAGSGENWMVPAGGTMFGTSRTVKNGKTVAYEFLAIREVEPGVLGYVAKPSGQEGATFRLVSASATEVLFENPGHDFPQRIRYRLVESRLEARIEGTIDGRERGIDFPMERTNCTP